MKFIKKSLSLLLIVVLCCSFVSCNSNQNFFLDEDYLTKEDELTISPYFAYYNNGKLPEKLKEIDPEIYKEGAVDDGAFNIYFAVCNNSEFDRKITEIKVKYIKTDDGYEIVEPCEFTLDNETYIESGQTLIIPCSFEKEFVKLEAKLDNIIAKTSVAYESCVLSAKNVPENTNDVLYYVEELKFTSSNGIEGKFTIDNQTNKVKKFKNISFMLYTDKGEKITKTPVKMDIGCTVDSSSILTLNFAILPDNVSDGIKETKLFDKVQIKVLGEVKQND